MSEFDALFQRWHRLPANARKQVAVDVLTWLELSLAGDVAPTGAAMRAAFAQALKSAPQPRARAETSGRV